MTQHHTMKAVALREYLPIDHANSLLDVELPTPSPQGAICSIVETEAPVELGRVRKLRGEQI